MQYLDRALELEKEKMEKRELTEEEAAQEAAFFAEEDKRRKDAAERSATVSIALVGRSDMLMGPSGNAWREKGGGLWMAREKRKKPYGVVDECWDVGC